MSWFAHGDHSRRRIRLGSLLRNVEMLEDRVFLADGITPLGARPSQLWWAFRSLMQSSQLIRSLTQSGEPGDQWRAHINFGDGQDDGPVIPVQKGAEFAFIDTQYVQRRRALTPSRS